MQSNNHTMFRALIFFYNKSKQACTLQLDRKNSSLVCKEHVKSRRRFVVFDWLTDQGPHSSSWEIRVRTLNADPGTSIKMKVNFCKRDEIKSCLSETAIF